MEVVVVGRFQQVRVKCMDRRTVGTKNPGRCRGVGRCREISVRVKCMDRRTLETVIERWFYCISRSKTKTRPNENSNKLNYISRQRNETRATFQKV